MPVEIRELHIRLTVQADTGKHSPAGPGQPNGAGPGGATEKDSLIAECVEQVLEILQSKKER